MVHIGSGPVAGERETGAHCVPGGTPAGQMPRRVPAARPPERAPPDRVYEPGPVHSGPCPLTLRADHRRFPCRLGDSYISFHTCSQNAAGSSKGRPAISRL